MRGRANRLAYAAALVGGAALGVYATHEKTSVTPHPPTVHEIPQMVHITEGLNARLGPGNLIVFTHKAMERFLRTHGRTKVTVYLHNIHGNQYVTAQYGQAIGGGNVGKNDKGDMAMECAPPKGKDTCELKVVRTDVDLKDKATTTTHFLEVEARNNPI
jgi:hypothetical protein